MVTSPVYTTENECQDYYKCVRHCPVKAIRIVDGKASVIPEACVACGECVKVCPAHAKKNESDAHPDELALAVLFPALEQFLEEKGIRFGEETELALGPAEEGRFYSVEGGMNDTLRDGRTDVRYVSVSGLEDFRRMLEDFDPAEFRLHPEKFPRKLFVEVLACPGGCQNGPCSLA